MHSGKVWMVGCWLAGGVAAWAADDALIMEPVTVIGSKEHVVRLPGTGEFLDADELRRRSMDDIQEALRRVPGVYFRTEDGLGLFPNISLRGVDGGRSSKVTLMEDGVLAAPAPYSGPAAYYSPAVGRMSGIEVLKGSSQVKHGPQTSGGVVNYLSTPIPREQSIYTKLMIGTYDEHRIHAYYGDRVAVGDGAVSYLVEFYERSFGGFKEIDRMADFTDTDRTGFMRREPILKLAWEPHAGSEHRFELMVGHTELTAYETYMGLTDEDFRRDPYRRYAGSRFDRIDTTQTRSYLRHHIALDSQTRVTTTAYYSEFTRNWFKERSDGQALGDPARLAVLRGEAAGMLNYRNNNRDYYSGGLDMALSMQRFTGDLHHSLDAGIRLHQDQVRRFQRDDTFVQDANGVILDRVNGVPGGGGNRKEQARAVALYVQDTMTWGGWTIVPGVRYENIRYDYTDYDTRGNPGRKTGEGDGTLEVVAPGIGLVRALTDETSLFGGVYRGFSIPGARAYVKDGIREETSIGYEAGLRYHDRRAVNAEVAMFLTDFRDLIVPDIVGAGGGSKTENAGDIRSWGTELKLAVDPGAALNWPVANPWYVTATWTDAELRSDVSSVDAESLFSGGRSGAKVPYIPQWQFLVGTGLTSGRWGIFVDVSYVEAMYTTALNTREPFDGAGVANPAYGKTDAVVLVDCSGYLQLAPGIKLVGRVNNLLDRAHVVARHPAGLRPGAPLTALAGLEFSF